MGTTVVPASPGCGGKDCVPIYDLKTTSRQPIFLHSPYPPMAPMTQLPCRHTPPLAYLRGHRGAENGVPTMLAGNLLACPHSLQRESGSPGRTTLGRLAMPAGRRRQAGALPGQPQSPMLFRATPAHRCVPTAHATAGRFCISFQGGRQSHDMENGLVTAN